MKPGGCRLRHSFHDFEPFLSSSRGLPIALLAVPRSLVELLICIIGGGVVKGTCETVARRLIGTFRGLRGVLSASVADCLAIEGIGPATVARLRAAREIGTRSLAESMVRDGPLDSLVRAVDYFRSLLRDDDREVFTCTISTLP